MGLQFIIDFLALETHIFCYALILVLAFVAFLYICFDVHYFVRTFTAIGYGMFFQQRVKPDETTSLPGFCTTNDVDVLLNHMNNARYIREADFGRFHFFARTGLLDEIRKVKGAIMQGACNIRYRKPIGVFSRYNITTRIVTWDEKTVFFEQQFITTDNFVRAVLISQQKILNLDISALLCKYLDKDPSYKPEVPEEIKLWLQSIEASSKRLRSKTE